MNSWYLKERTRRDRVVHPYLSRSFRPRRRGPRFSLVAVAVLVTAFGLFGWMTGRMSAVPEIQAPQISVYRHDLDASVKMSIEDYIKGVIAAEMPVNFHLEALKAQAVAARTLALHLIEQNQPLDGNPGTFISTDFRTHQGWISEDELRQQWGNVEFYRRWGKISRAVAETRGLVVVYEGKPIFSAFHSSSGGRTENSENYWSSVTPYLRSVEDPFIAGSRYEETVERVPLAVVAQRVGVAAEVMATAGGSARPPIWVESRFPSGRVETVLVGEEPLTGRQLREALGLRSNWFDVHVDGEDVIFTVKGYGHGVGLSQYGADGMARAGYSFDQILRHYYTGVEIVSWYD